MSRINIRLQKRGNTQILDSGYYLLREDNNEKGGFLLDGPFSSMKSLEKSSLFFTGYRLEEAEELGFNWKILYISLE